MKHRAALLLVVILMITTGVLSKMVAPAPTDRLTSSPQPTPSPNRSSPSPPPPDRTSSPDRSSPSPPPDGTSPASLQSALSVEPRVIDKMIQTPLPWRLDSLMNPQEVLLQEIRSMDEESTDEKVEEALVKATEADAKKNKPVPTSFMTEEADQLSLVKPTAKSDIVPLQIISRKGVSYSTELMEDDGLNFNETEPIFMADDDDWDEDDDDEDEDDEDDEDDDLDDVDDDLDDEEEVLFDQNCPLECRCSEEFTGVTTARCTKYSNEQTFGSKITSLKIENSADIELSPHDLREKGLHQLRSFTIVDTRISTVDKTAFDGIPNLFAINMTRNGLLGIHPDTFENNTQLNLLTLSGNPLQFTQGKSNKNIKYFLSSTTVSELDLSDNGLTRLLSTTFVRMPRLVYINLRNNRLRTVDKTIFAPLDQLEELDLSNNQLTGLPADVFDANNYLETLHISGNDLSSLATFNISSLDSLDVSKNRIKIVAKDDLSGIPNLERLYLRSNGLKRIHPHAFINLAELTYLDISDNKITMLEEHHLRTNSHLEVLIMNDNPGLKALPVFKSQNEGFSVTRFECADCGLHMLQPRTFDTMSAMIRLNLARNSLSSLPNGLLKEMSSLRELDLSDNQFKSLEPTMFEGTRSMTKLNLAGNPLATLQVSPFLLTPSLSKLDLSRCALEKLWSGPIMPLESLRFLSVRGNHIERINVEDLEATPKLSGLDISHLPLECSQEFNAVIQWLVDHGVSPTETLRYMSNYGETEYYSELEGPNKWTDLAKVICDSIEDGPPPRVSPRKQIPDKDAKPTPVDDLDVLAKSFNHGITDNGQRLGDAWMSEEQEYEEYAVVGANYRPWYSGALWPVMTVILVTLAVVLFVINLSVYLSKRRGRGPVIRAPMILRPGLIDNKNCGLVYKPLQEEIPTPQMAKRGSFYSSSTFHYDKIVPESV